MTTKTMMMMTIMTSNDDFVQMMTMMKTMTLITTMTKMTMTLTKTMTTMTMTMMEIMKMMTMTMMIMFFRVQGGLYMMIMLVMNMSKMILRSSPPSSQFPLSPRLPPLPPA
jgi:hypothetical protein